jgi:hypothetical protein
MTVPTETPTIRLMAVAENETNRENPVTLHTSGSPWNNSLKAWIMPSKIRSKKPLRYTIGYILY